LTIPGGIVFNSAIGSEIGILTLRKEGNALFCSIVIKQDRILHNKRQFLNARVNVYFDKDIH
jgi:hypothetical protein